MSPSQSIALLAADESLVWTGDQPPGDAEGMAALLADAVRDKYRVDAHGAESLTLTHLDTVDARVRRAGLDVAYLANSTTSGTLVALRAGETPRCQPVGKVRWPAELADLADGPVRALLAGPVWIRALIPYLTSRTHGRTFSLLNADDKTVCRVAWWTTSLTAGDPPVAPRLRVVGLRGYERDAKAATALLRANLPVERHRQSWFADLPQPPGLAAADAPREPMTPDQPARTVVANALLGYLDELEANVAGAVEDIDTEFLHDLRVAVRRTRSVLKILGDVLPGGIADRVAPEFRWLGQITTPTRDLDVYLLGVDDMAASITNPGDLEAFAKHLRRRRDGVRRTLVRELRSSRFTDLRESWRADLEGVLEAAPGGPGSAADVANNRIHRVFRSVRKRAAAITAASPAEDIHSLRKKCKELRYLLETFAPICDKRVYKQVIGDFKELQKVLGDFQDGEVQATALRTFAQEMIDQADAPAAALLAMGDLAARFDQRQRSARAELTDHHDDYLGKRAAQHVDRLIPT